MNGVDVFRVVEPSCTTMKETLLLSATGEIRCVAHAPEDWHSNGWTYMTPSEVSEYVRVIGYAPVCAICRERHP